MADWQKIKTEYISENTSYRKLAEKYGISYQAICRRSKAEQWGEPREQHMNKTVTKALDKICDKKADRAVRLQSVADKLLGVVEDFIENASFHGVSSLDTQSMKHISGVLKDIKEVQMIRSDADMREQEARIANLRKQAEAENTNTEPVRVIIEDDLKKYSQ